MADRAARPGCLHRRSRALASPAPRPPPAPRTRSSPTGWTTRTLVEALDDLGAPELYSADGYARLQAYAQELAELRQRLDQPLPDLMADIERTTGLDVEVAVRGWGAGDAGLARGHLDALGNVAARYAGDADGGTLPASWRSWPLRKRRSAAWSRARSMWSRAPFRC